MKCISLSDRVYYKDLNEEFVSALKDDMSLYNSMVHKAYKRFDEALESRCLKDVVSIIKVNPAYTSKTAKSRYCPVMGCSVHMAASYLIARTGQFTY